MLRFAHKFVRYCRSRSASGLVEYAIIIALVALVAVMTLRRLGRNANRQLRTINTTLRR
jgi:Flp pilus assembly pilin Flp